MNLLRQVMEDNKLSGNKGLVLVLLGVVTTLIFLYTSCFGSFEALIQRGLLLILTLPMVFLVAPLVKGRKSGLGLVVDIIFIAMAVLSFGYIMLIQDQLMLRGGIPNQVDTVMGSLAILVILEATRRKVGLALPIIAAIFIAYGFLGPNLPGIFMHRGLDMQTLISATYLGEEGIFGTPVAVTASFIFIFILFGSFLNASGAGEFFSELANGAFGWMRGGPAKAAVVSSALMGTISGSAVANVMTVGTFTIPLMKKTGYKGEVAGAIEAVGSTGGQIMPPIMGAAAFIMAEFLQVQYIDVVLAAIIPAALYYMSLFFVVDLEAAKAGLRGLSRSELPSPLAIMKKSGYLLLPLLMLIVLLGFVQYSPQRAAFFTIVFLLLITAVKPHTRMGLRKFLSASVSGAIGVLEVAAVCACAGIVIGILMRTGLGMALTGILVELSGGSLPILMVLTMLCSTLLGMGLPTSACYIIVAVLIAPAMISMGVAPMAAHMFSFYYAIMSCITPPVALAAYASAGIAKVSPMKCGWCAFAIGITGFIVPYMFVYGPQLLMIGEPAEILWAFCSALLGIFVLAMAITGHLFTRINIPLRIVSFFVALLLIIPGLKTDMMGLAVFAAILVYNRFIFNKQYAGKSLAR